MYQFSNPQVQPIDVAGGVQNYLAMKQGKEQQDYEKKMKERTIAAEENRVKIAQLSADTSLMVHMIDYAEKSGDVNAANSIAEQVGSKIRLSAVPKKAGGKLLKFTVPSASGSYTIEGDPNEIRSANADVLAALQQNPGAVDSNFIASLKDKYPSLVIGQTQKESKEKEKKPDRLLAKDINEAEQVLMSESGTDPAIAVPRINQYNAIAEGDSFYRFNEGSGKAEKVQLPKLPSGDQLTMSDVRDLAEETGLSIDETIDEIYNRLGMKPYYGWLAEQMMLGGE